MSKNYIPRNLRLRLDNEGKTITAYIRARTEEETLYNVVLADNTQINNQVVSNDIFDRRWFKPE